ncbi:MAG: hypothetical protein IJ055_05830 [Oscillospiraceae bacterium]|nr:hypothetical protein [Oscillospiraceae bacterium]
MRKYMTVYEHYLQEFLKKPRDKELSALRREVLVQIGFMQHERLIHFLVTMLFAILFMIGLGICLIRPSVGMTLLVVLLLALLVPYIWHYYFLENTTQRMYVLYNRIAALDDGIEYPNTDALGKI